MYLNKQGVHRMNTREIAKHNELEVLKALANCGWMTTSMLARWVWLNSSVHVANNKAQLVLKRLVAKKLVLERQTTAGVKTWVLTQPGADLVNKTFERAWAQHGYDISTLHMSKQMLITNFLIEQRQYGREVIGKAGIRAGLVHESLSDCDAVVLDGDYTFAVLVVSNSRTTTVERVARLEKVCETSLIGDSHLITRVRKELEQWRSR